VVSWDDTSKLFFFLYAPEQKLFRYTRPGMAFGEETGQSVHFDNGHFTKVQIPKGIGEILLHREMPNGKTGEEFATSWKTLNVAEEGYNGLAFTIVNRTPDTDVKMLAWNKEHPDDLYTDCVAIEHGAEVRVWLYLAPDKFHDLLNLNWRAKFLEVSLETSPSIHNLKFPLEENDKTKMREGTFISDSSLSHRKLVIHTYEITVKDLPVVRLQDSKPSLLNHLYELLRFRFGR